MPCLITPFGIRCHILQLLLWRSLISFRGQVIPVLYSIKWLNDCTTTIVFIIYQLYFSSIGISPLILIHPIALPRKKVRSNEDIPPILAYIVFHCKLRWGCIEHLIRTGSLNFGSISFNFDFLLCFYSSLNKITC